MKKDKGGDSYKRIGGLLILWLLILGMELLGQVLSYAQPREEKIPQNVILLYEKKYESEVKQVVLREDGNLKAVATAKKVIFYGDKGEVIKEIPLKVVPHRKSAEGVDEIAKFAPNGEYALIMSGVPEWAWKMRYVDTKGKVLWKKEGVYGYAVISPDGEYIAIVDEGRTEFLNKIGQVVNTKDFEKDPWMIHRGTFSGDGNYFALVLGEIPSAGDHRLIFFTKDGYVLWERKLKARPVEIKISYDGRVALWLDTEGYDSAFLFNKDGVLIKQMEVRNRTLWDKLTFSATGDLLLEAIPERHYSPKIKRSQLRVYEVFP